MINAAPKKHIMHINIALKPRCTAEERSHSMPPKRAISAAVRSSSPMPIIMQTGSSKKHLAPPISIESPLVF
ncbi:MAG: hypothetical protein L6V88_12125 [Anaerotruncus sp.]|nr:MAG: hypothetical protein L6V88_12125 [Anaerotruncus sp.]